ncbi:QacE family quaternary ammonium compound efflux SMR transporter [Nakamurella sp. YIM 132087]|uniref:QacE family quaternary ammonium compound efflux SMR transporter n=1 Tax=Nakamurella alba TaxID=2665158 RepID=A0A7K1FFQ6_9ACTN|nr:SMR family transporter [Nakamurella alba]MTD12900.1 QacE family quaternary ammonium compound efflux SMR transporter [Nakamurella alba]
MKLWLLLAAAISSEVIATLSLKAALDHPAWYLLVVTGYLSAFAFLSICLRFGMPIGKAYGIWGAGGVAATALLSAALFGEKLTLVMGLGILLIIAGVLTVELGSSAHSRDAGNGDAAETAA